MLDQQAVLDQKAASSKQAEVNETLGEDPPVGELKLSAVEKELLDYHAIVSQRLATPVPDSTAGISLSQIQGLLEAASQKYWVALFL